MRWSSERWVGIAVPYSPGLIDDIKRLPLRAYDPATRTWWFPRALVGPAERAIQYHAPREFEPYRDPPLPPLLVPDACRVLGVLPEAPAAVVAAAFRALALEHHPDRGGSVSRFQEIEAARAELLGVGRS